MYVEAWLNDPLPFPRPFFFHLRFLVTRQPICCTASTRHMFLDEKRKVHRHHCLAVISLLSSGVCITLPLTHPFIFSPFLILIICILFRVSLRSNSSGVEAAMTIMSSHGTNKPFLTDIIQRCVERLGKKQMWRVIYAIQILPEPVTPTTLRDALRDISIYLTDDNFADLCHAYTISSSSDGDGEAAAIDVSALIADLCSATLSPRRQHVVDLVIAKLNPRHAESISFEAIRSIYDVLRHPDVLNGLRCEDDVASDFFDNFMVNGDEGEDDTRQHRISEEELRAFFVGISAATAEDVAFELYCTRAFCLDRPKLSVIDEEARIASSKRVSRQSRILGNERRHPLYTTTNGEYGRELTPSDYTISKVGRSYKFTQNLPPRATGGATTMNM